MVAWDEGAAGPWLDLIEGIDSPSPGATEGWTAPQSYHSPLWDREKLSLSNPVLLLGRKLEKAIRIGKKGVTTIPKSIRQDAGILEGSQVRAKALPYGILLRPLVTDPIETLENLPAKRRGKSSVETVRRLRERIDGEVRKKRR